MTTGTPTQSPVKFLLTILGLTALAILATILIGYFVTTAPRGFMVWVTVGLLCTVEFLVGILSVNSLLTERSQYRPSGATVAITMGIVGLFAASAIVSLVVYRSIRDAGGTRDGSFLAVLIGIIVFWFIVAALIYSWDLRTQAVSRPMGEKRAEHRDLARSLSPVLSAIRSVRTEDDDHRSRLSVLTKRLEMIDVALAHSHGGALGSRETGRSHPAAPDQDRAIQDGIALIDGIVPRLSGRPSSDVDAALTELEQCVTRVLAAVNALELH
jgi:hypothetical protein